VVPVIRYLLAFGAALSLGPAAASQAPSPPSAQTRPPQRPDGADYWTASDERMTFTAARISFPRRAGAVGLNRSIAFGQRNAGLDNGLIYASDDRALIATAYVYLPGREGVAIRADYAGFRDSNEASSSAFLKAGRWIVKLRVSGPESRRGDVERTLAAFLEEIRFEGDIVPRGAEPIELVDCPPAAAAPTAALLAANAPEAMEDAIMALAVGLHDNERADNPRRWCVSSLRRLGPYTLPTLRLLPSAPTEDSRRSVALAILNDSGGVLEVVERRFRNRSRFLLLYHRTGRTLVLGAYDALPSDAQINAVLDETDPAGGRPRATIDYRASGDANITLHVMPDAPAVN